MKKNTTKMNPETELYLAHALLIELLAYQFASPVRWIETQDVILNKLKAEKIIEIGPQPILKNMMNKTLVDNNEFECSNGISSRFVKCCSTDLHEIYYDLEKTNSSRHVLTDDSKIQENSSANFIKNNILQALDFTPRSQDQTPFDHFTTYSDCVSSQVKSCNPESKLTTITVQEHCQNHPFLEKSRDADNMNLYCEIQKLNNVIDEIKVKNIKIENEFTKSAIDESIIQVFQPNRIRTFDSYWAWTKFEMFKYCVNPEGSANTFNLERLQNLIELDEKTEETNGLHDMLRYFNKTLTKQGNKKLLNALKRFKYVKNILLDNSKHIDDALNHRTVAAKLDTDISSYYKVENMLFEVYSKIIAYASPSVTNLDESSTDVDNLKEFENVYDQLLVFLINSNEVNPYFRNIVNQALFSINKKALNDPIADDFSSDSSDFELTTDSEASSRSSTLSFDDDLMDEKFNKNLQMANNATCELPIVRGIIPAINIQSWSEENKTWVYNKSLTHKYLRVIIDPDHQNLKNKNILISLPRLDKFSSMLIKQLFSAGVHVYILQACFSTTEISAFAEQLDHLFKKYSTKNSKLFIIPLNLLSKADCVNFVNYYYTTMSIDFEIFLPLHLLYPDHDALFSSVIFLIDEIVNNKIKHATDTSPLHVLLASHTSKSLLNLADMHNKNHNKNYVSYMGISLEICDNIGHQYETTVENVLSLLNYELVTVSQTECLIANLTDCHLPMVHEDKKILQKNIISISHEYVVPKISTTLIQPKFSEFNTLKNEYNGELLQGMLDLDSIVVFTGFGEIGPYGHANTRWQIESCGELSIEGCLEMAWLMGYITYDGVSGEWIDNSTKLKVDTVNIKSLYESKILENSGIRFVDSQMFEGYNPGKKQLLQEIVLTHDLKPVEMSKELAQQYLLENGNKVKIEILENDQRLVTFLKGCTMFVPKALNFNRFVAGQIPTGWNPATYGISKDTINQVDRVTLYALVATVEALICSGITDPFELYQYIHVSEVGNCMGSGLGGLTSHKKMQKGRLIDADIQNDILQETFLNSMPAWINMLLLGSSGPIKTPVGACATALESLDVGYETIMSGKAKFVLVGGQDDYSEETAYEFANMGATSNSQTELDIGRHPKEMCRPMTTTRAGFMESQGSGIQVLTTASLAIKMGLPIFGVVGMVSLAADKISKSLPAPGKGIMTVARQVESKFKPKILDLTYRKLQLEKSFQSLFYKDVICDESCETFKASRKYWGTEFFKNNYKISPLVGCLSVFGLTVDDIGAASCHGTSTKANDKNEASIVNDIMTHLKRAKGNSIPIVCQKSITGHPKAAAAAWMINGALQMFNDSMVPGNPNFDNIDPNFREYEHLVFPFESTRVETLKAIMVTSFGFGQKGALAVLINPNYVLASLNEAEYKQYINRVNNRYFKAQQYRQNGIMNNKLIVEKTASPYTDEVKTYLDPLIRASHDNVINNDNQNVVRASFFNSEIKKYELARWEAILDTADIESFVQKCISEYYKDYLVSLVPASKDMFRLLFNKNLIPNIIVSFTFRERQLVCHLYKL